jgi:hypothetical protein
MAPFPHPGLCSHWTPMNNEQAAPLPGSFIFASRQNGGSPFCGGPKPRVISFCFYVENIL